MNDRPEWIDAIPSASAMHRLANCPASLALSKAARAAGMVPPAGPEATAGTRIHKALEGGCTPLDSLTDSEWDTVSQCERQRDDLIKAWIFVRGHDFCEQRFAMYSDGSCGIVNSIPDRAADIICTGQADYLLIDDGVTRRGFLCDYKTGPGEVEDAASNKQLRALAAMVSGALRLNSVRVAIIQPLAGAPTVADYSTSELYRAGWWTDKHSKLAIASDGSNPVAGDWCQYCPARAMCPELRGAATSAPDYLDVDSLPAGKEREAMTARAIALPADELSRLLHGRRMIGYYLAAIEAAARIRLDAGESVPGWELRERLGKREISDPSAAAAAVAPLLANADGGSAAAIMRAAELRPAVLTKEIQRASGPKLKADGTPAARGYALSEPAAKQALADALGENLTRRTSTVLAKVGAQLDDDDA